MWYVNRRRKMLPCQITCPELEQHSFLQRWIPFNGEGWFCVIASLGFISCRSGKGVMLWCSFFPNFFVHLVAMLKSLLWKASKFFHLDFSYPWTTASFDRTRNFTNWNIIPSNSLPLSVFFGSFLPSHDFLVHYWGQTPHIKQKQLNSDPIPKLREIFID